jgi:hypothetical protein
VLKAGLGSVMRRQGEWAIQQNDLIIAAIALILFC